MRHVVYSAWRVFYSCFIKALGRASCRTWILKGTPLFFSAPELKVSGLSLNLKTNVKTKGTKDEPETNYYGGGGGRGDRS